MQIRASLLLAIAIATTGCARLGPELRTAATPLQGELVEGCKNLDDGARVETLYLGSYRTTYMSALVEGATAGVDDGLTRGGGPIADAMRSMASMPDQSKSSDMLDNLFSDARTFCRVYDAEMPLVASAVAMVIPYLQNGIEISDQLAGIFLTELSDRSHSAAKWKDSYAIKVSELEPGKTVVRVTRFVYISRMGSPYYGAISDGNNEGWILTRVLDIVSSSPRVAAQPQ